MYKRQNFERMNRSAERMAIPQFDVDVAMAGLVKLLEVEKDWVPHTQGATLYIRPTIIAMEMYIRDSGYITISDGTNSDIVKGELAENALVVEESGVQMPFYPVSYTHLDVYKRQAPRAPSPCVPASVI